MEKRLQPNNSMIASRIRALRREIEAAFGLPTQLLRILLGPFLVWTSKRQDRRLANGVTFDPKTFIERHNWVEEAVEGTQFRVVTMAQRGFRPSMENVAARVWLPKEPALTVTGD